MIQDTISTVTCQPAYTENLGIIHCNIYCSKYFCKAIDLLRQVSARRRFVFEQVFLSIIPDDDLARPTQKSNGNGRLQDEGVKLFTFDCCDCCLLHYGCLWCNDREGVFAFQSLPKNVLSNFKNTQVRSRKLQVRVFKTFSLCFFIRKVFMKNITTFPL